MPKNMEHIAKCLTPVRFYQTTDGKSFAIKSDAESHQADIIGELLDALIPENEGVGFYRRVKQHVLLQILNDSSLHYKVRELVKHTTPCTINNEGEDLAYEGLAQILNICSTSDPLDRILAKIDNLNIEELTTLNQKIATELHNRIALSQF